MVLYSELSKEQVELFYKIFIRSLKNLGLFPFHSFKNGTNPLKKDIFTHWLVSTYYNSEVIKKPWDIMWVFSKDFIGPLNSSLVIIEMCNNDKLYNVVSKGLSKKEFNEIIKNVITHELKYIINRFSAIPEAYKETTSENVLKIYNYYKIWGINAKPNDSFWRVYVENFEKSVNKLSTDK